MPSPTRLARRVPRRQAALNLRVDNGYNLDRRDEDDDDEEDDDSGARRDSRGPKRTESSPATSDDDDDDDEFRPRVDDEEDDGPSSDGANVEAEDEDGFERRDRRSDAARSRGRSRRQTIAKTRRTGSNPPDETGPSVAASTVGQATSRHEPASRRGPETSTGDDAGQESDRAPRVLPRARATPLNLSPGPDLVVQPFGIPRPDRDHPGSSASGPHHQGEGAIGVPPSVPTTTTTRPIPKQRQRLLEIMSNRPAGVRPNPVVPDSLPGGEARPGSTAHVGGTRDAATTASKGSRRRRIELEGRGRSCEQCRNRKIKCSSHEVCTSCRLRGEVCEWKTGTPLYVTSNPSLALDNSLRLERARLVRTCNVLARRWYAREKELSERLGRDMRRVPGIADVDEGGDDEARRGGKDPSSTISRAGFAEKTAMDSLDKRNDNGQRVGVPDDGHREARLDRTDRETNLLDDARALLALSRPQSRTPTESYSRGTHRTSTVPSTTDACGEGTRPPPEGDPTSTSSMSSRLPAPPVIRPFGRLDPSRSSALASSSEFTRKRSVTEPSSTVVHPAPTTFARRFRPGGSDSAVPSPGGPPTTTYFPSIASPFVSPDEVARLRSERFVYERERRQPGREDERRRRHVERYRRRFGARTEDGPPLVKRRRTVTDGAAMSSRGDDDNEEEARRRQVARLAAETWAAFNFANDTNEVDPQTTVSVPPDESTWVGDLPTSRRRAEHTALPPIVVPVEPYRSISSSAPLRGLVGEDPMLALGAPFSAMLSPLNGRDSTYLKGQDEPRSAGQGGGGGGGGGAEPKGRDYIRGESTWSAGFLWSPLSSAFRVGVVGDGAEPTSPFEIDVGRLGRIAADATARLVDDASMSTRGATGLPPTTLAPSTGGRGGAGLGADPDLDLDLSLLGDERFEPRSERHDLGSTMLSMYSVESPGVSASGATSSAGRGFDFLRRDSFALEQSRDGPGEPWDPFEPMIERRRGSVVVGDGVHGEGGGGGLDPFAWIDGADQFGEQLATR